MRYGEPVLVLCAVLSSGVAAGAGKDLSREVMVVPNFHPASCGWLTDFSRERNYCANSYLDHLDRVRADETYAFVISEVNNMIAIPNFVPERFEELRQRIASGRVEAVNAFFLESAICLSGGEALVKQGVEGLRWQEAVKDLRRVRDPLEASFFEQQADIESRALEMFERDPGEARGFLNRYTWESMDRIVELYRDLRKLLITKYTNNKLGL